jgi:hypothetical protein
MSDRTLRSHSQEKGKITQINMTTTASQEKEGTNNDNEQIEITPQGIPQGLPKENWLEYLLATQKMNLN